MKGIFMDDGDFFIGMIVVSALYFLILLPLCFFINIFIVIVIISLAGLAALILLRIRYTHYIYPIKEKIKYVTQDKPPVFPAKSIIAIFRNTKAVQKKIFLLKMKIRKIRDYIIMLHKHKKDAGKMMGKQKEYYRYFCKYYDAYCALYVGMRFQFYMELIKKLLPAKKKIHKLDVKNFTDAIEKDIWATVRILTNDNELDSDLKEIDDEFDSDFKRIDTEDHIPGKFDKHLPHDNDSPIVIRIPVSKNKQEDIIFELEETAGQIAAISEKIRQAAMHLITIQSHEIIGGTSPLDDANILNKYTQNHDFEEIMGHSKELNDEYDRFAAEIELSADSGGKRLFWRK